MGSDPSSSTIAVVGMACHYPGARNLRQFWENILAKRRQFRPFPDVRLPLADYYDPDPNIPDKTYGNKAGLIDGFQFDWAGHRIPKSTIDSTDIAHWLALDVALQSLRDAGLNRHSVPVDRSGVILGNTLTGEHSRAEGLRLRWPFVRRTLKAAADAKGLSPQALSDLLQTMEMYYKSVFAPVTEDTLSGGLSNTIAGRICNYLDFHGGGYTVDGACSSSLVAVATAATSLMNGDLDLALAGGVDISLDTFELIGFAKTAALTTSDMRVYDHRANGFIPGEGCGFVVLKRLTDAVADNNYIYAVLRGWGISSDGKGGLTAPSSKGQAAALQRAYERAGYSPEELNFIEGHGTGTVVGDKTELEAISLAMGERKETDMRPCGITSLKSIVGHTKAAAGIGGFIKAAIAVNRRILPPTANCTEPNDVFRNTVRSVYPIIAGELRLPSAKLKAGISAMGFGGINCHVTIESGDSPSSNLAPSVDERKLLASHQGTEVFVLSAASVSELLERTQTVMQRSQDLCEGELIDLAGQLARELTKDAPVRAAAVAGTPEALAECLQTLEKNLRETPPPEGEAFVSRQKNLFIGNNIQKSRVGFLFPGQGSQFLNMGRTLVERHEWAQRLLSDAVTCLEEHGSKDITRFIFKSLDRAIDDNQIAEWKGQLRQTDIAQPAICLSSLLWIHKLSLLGIGPAVAGGHSLGELTAFHAAGAFHEHSLLKLASTRGKAMAAPGEKSGIMASLGCSQENAIDVLNRVKGYAVIANINSPRQIVISGEKTSVEEAVNIAKGKGIKTHILAVSNAFHSRFVASAAEYLRGMAPVPKRLGSLKTRLISAMNGREIKEGVNLQDHFANQVSSQVDFVSLVEEMVKHCDVLLEVGPGRVLSGLANTIIQDDSIMCLPIESGEGKDRDLNVFLGNFFVNGGEVKWEALYRDRLVRPFVPASERIFIENPCERPYKVSPPGPLQTVPGGHLESSLTDKLNIAPHVLAEYLSHRHQFIEAVIRADLDNLPSSKSSAAEISGPPAQQAIPEFSYTMSHTPEKEHMEPDTGSVSDLLFALLEKRTGFPRESLTKELRLLDDLNLDSIKAAELLAEVTTRLGAAGNIDVSKYANATLDEIISAFQTIKDPGAPAAGADVQSDKTAWVRNFVVDPVEETFHGADPAAKAEDWKEANILIISEPAEQTIAGNLGRQLTEQGARTQAALFEDAAGLGRSGNEAFTDVIAILPRVPGSTALNEDRLSVMIHRLSTVVSLQTAVKNRTVAFIQFGGGYFGTKPGVSDIELCASAALAASLHLERPDLKVRVLDFAPQINAARMAEKVIMELSTPDNYASVGYDLMLTRRIPRLSLQEPADYASRPVSWTSEDVVLVTGGAKGITAECALALARATNVRMALAGSSPQPRNGAGPDEGGEIALTLKRFYDEGLTARYYQCNVTDAHAVDNLVKEVQKDLGSISCVIHGSALNKPHDIDKTSPEGALREVAPKVLGAVNLCNALKDSPPRLFMGFSSIIGISGMMRNAWYGFSNEALNLVLCRFEQDHPGTSVLSIAFSIWDEIGMGVRLGSTAYLAQMGIGAIPPKEGVRRFLQLVMNDPGEKQVIVAARIAGLDTIQPPPFPLPKASRFLEKIMYYFPEVEIVARAHLSLERDPYIKDHLWRGTYLFPTVFGLEAMAQAAAYVTGEDNFDSLRIEDIRLERPVTVNPEEGAEIELHAEVLEREPGQDSRKVRVAIGTGQTGFAVEHFSATFVFNAVEDISGEELELSGAPLEIQPDQDLYNGKLLFQGPLFQRITHVYSLDSKKCVFRSALSAPVNDSAGPQKEITAGPWLLGDPFFRDSLLHSAQLPVSRDISLPVKIKSIERFRVKDGMTKSLTGAVTIENRNDSKIFAKVVTFNESGRLVERINGYVLKILEHHEEYPAPEEIADPGKRDERIIIEEIKKRAGSLGLSLPEISAAHLPGLHQLTKTERHIKELPVLREAIKRNLNIRGDVTKEDQVTWLPSGRPKLEGKVNKDLDISLSHDDDTLLCVAGTGLQGCDIAPVSKRSRLEWIALLGSEKKPLLQKLPESGDPLDRAGTRIWAATEAFRKATNAADPNLTIEMHTDDTVVFRSKTSDSDLHALTFPVQLTRSPEKIVAVVARSSGEKKQGNKPAAGPMQNVHMKRLNFDLDSYKADIVDGPQGQPVFIFQFPVTFREASNPSRTLYFSHYFAWIGKLREFVVHPVYEHLVKWFSTGQWGMVTNNAETTVFGEAVSGDVVEGRVWLDNLSGNAQSTLEFCFQWRKLLQDGKHELIAESNMSTTWVEIKGHGTVEVKPLPEFAQDFVKKLLPPSGEKKARHSPSVAVPHIDFGKQLHAEPSGPVNTSSLLQERIFETALEDANLVGNVYFSNYYVWQGRVRDHFLHKTAPEYFSGPGNRGELRCIGCRVHHTGEAMPFDRIAVRMFRRNIYERGIRFYFDYYRITADGKRYKLGHGEHEALWFSPNGEGKWVPSELPSVILDALLPGRNGGALLSDYSKPSGRKDQKGNRYDAIVVGSGMGGLSAGAMLAKYGKKTLVVEQHDKPGGFCTSWERLVKHNGTNLRFVFNAGVQDISGLNRYIGKLLRELDIEDRIKWLTISHEYIFPGFHLKVPRSLKEYIDALSRKFPNEAEGLLSFFREIENCYRELFKTEQYNPSYISRWMNIPFIKMMDTFIHDERLKKILSILHCYISDDVTKVNTLKMIPLFYYYFYGGHYPSGGAQVLPNTLVSVIKKHNSDMRLRTAVSRILIEDGHTVGVELANGEKISSDIVISNADIRRTFLELVGSEHLPPYFARRIESMRPSNSAFEVFLGVDFVPDLEPVTLIEEKNEILGIMVPSKADPSLAPPGHSCISLIMLLPHDKARAWKHDEADYAGRKRQFGDRLILIAEKAIPGLRGHILYREDASPATFARYAGTTSGAIYGLAIDEWRPSIKTPVEGLYLTGASVSIRPGVEDAVFTGMKVAETIIKEKQEARTRRPLSL